MRTLLRLALLLSLLAPAAAQPPATAAAGCRYVLGFRTLRDLIPDVVGACLVDEHHNAQNGDGLQETAGRSGKGGLLVWRKADNWTAYTDGSDTWVNGPFGLQRRPNTARFAWEVERVTTAPRGGSRGAPARVSAVGDSVMLGAIDRLQLAIPNLVVDAEIGRKVTPAIAVLRAWLAAGQLGDVVVVGIGNNAPVSPAQVDEVMRIAGDRRVVFVNLKVPLGYEAANNAVLADGVRRYPGSQLVDWHAAATDHPEYIWDGVHLTQVGARAYAALVAVAVGAP